MNTQCSYFFYIVAVMFSNVVVAKKSNFTTGTRHLGRNAVVSVANRKFQGYPFAQTVTATSYKITEDYHKGNAPGNEKLIRASIQDHVPYFVINYSLRKTVQLGSDHSDAVVDIIKWCDIVPEGFLKVIIQDTMEHITPTIQEAAYDIATAAIITYLLPPIMEQFK